MLRCRSQFWRRTAQNAVLCIPGDSDRTKRVVLIRRVEQQIVAGKRERADFLFLEHETGLTRGNLSVQLSRLAENQGHCSRRKTGFGEGLAGLDRKRVYLENSAGIR